jgi:hypothetical protein
VAGRYVGDFPFDPVDDARTHSARKVIHLIRKNYKLFKNIVFS